MWIFPQTKTAQIHFSSKDTRRVRHGRASTTEGFAKVLNASVGGTLVMNRQDLFIEDCQTRPKFGLLRCADLIFF